MLKNVFVANSSRGKSYSVKTLLGMLSAGSMPELEAKHRELTDKVTKILGRPPTESEMRNGIPKPKPPQAEVSETRRAKANQDYAARLEQEAAYSPEAQRLKTARERAEQERVAALSPIQRELEAAETAARLAQERQADKARKAEIRAGATYQRIRTDLENVTLIAMLDVSISQGTVDALKRESASLEQTMDLATVRVNLSTIQTAITNQTAVEAAQLKAAVDRAELRRQMLASGQVWDDIGVELVGENEYVSLTVGNETRRVTKARFDGRASDENLKSELFGETANV